jgi:hypothetical protein
VRLHNCCLSLRALINLHRSMPPQNEKKKNIYQVNHTFCK